MSLPRRTSAPDHATFFFDFRDPYAYLASAWVPRLAVDSGIALTLAPIDSLELGHRGGMTGPLASSSLQDYLWLDVERAAGRLGVAIHRPPRLPFDSRPLLRACLAVRERSGQEAMAAFADSLWHEVWERGRDPESCDTTLSAARDAAVPEPVLREAVEGQRGQALLDRVTGRAAERGVFTVPTVEVEGSLYSGIEEIGRLEQALRGAGLLGGEEGRSQREGPDDGVPDWTFSG